MKNDKLITISKKDIKILVTCLSIIFVNIILQALTNPSKKDYLQYALVELKPEIKEGICLENRIRLVDSDDCRNLLESLQFSNSNYLQEWVYKHTSFHNFLILTGYLTQCKYETVSESGSVSFGAVTFFWTFIPFR